MLTINNKALAVMGMLTAITIIGIALKVSGQITWSWWIIFMPIGVAFLAPTFIFLFLIFLYGLLTFIQESIEKKK